LEKNKLGAKCTSCFYLHTHASGPQIPVLYPPVFTKLHPSYHLNYTQPDHAMWQSPPCKSGQPYADTCHNPPLTKMTNQILPRHHLTHETLTLIFIISFHHHGSSRRQSRRQTSGHHSSTIFQPWATISPCWKTQICTSDVFRLHTKPPHLRAKMRSSTMEACSTAPRRSCTIHGPRATVNHHLRLQLQQRASTHLAATTTSSSSSYEFSIQKQCKHHHHDRVAATQPATATPP